MFRNNHPTRTALSFIALLLTLFLGASPALAVEPQEADPDPDESPASGGMTVLIVDDLADLDVSRLAPGRYVVRVVDDEGVTRAVHEIVVRR